ncbi:MAG: hypothetical protein AB1646_09725, partial [Thermodesulfobacteriota bacterium]
TSSRPGEMGLLGPPVVTIVIVSVFVLLLLLAYLDQKDPSDEAGLRDAIREGLRNVAPAIPGGTHSSDTKRWDEDKLAKELGVDQRELHAIKKDILSDSPADVRRRAGQNPDIGVNPKTREISLINSKTGKHFPTGLKINGYRR